MATSMINSAQKDKKMTLVDRFWHIEHALESWIRASWPWILLLALVVTLRIPNFADPYWYGDEGIYLTVGNALRDGERLYSEIIDHKTPLIYYMAAIGGQTAFRSLLLVWMLATTAAFMWFVKQLTQSRRVTILATAFFVLLTSLPWLEGHIPNGELFVMGFVLFGAAALTKTSLFQSLINQKTLSKPSSKDTSYLSLTGILLGLGILTKVPGLLDTVAFLAIGWFVWCATFWPKLIKDQKSAFQKAVASLWQVIPHQGIIISGILLPILASVGYFWLRGSAAAYLDFGLLYNFRYAGSWQPFEAVWLQHLFSLPAKVGWLGLTGLILTGLTGRISGRIQFSVLWVVLALVAATLSNRPYPHYFLQVIPPLAVLLAVFLTETGALLGDKKVTSLLLNTSLGLGVVGWTALVMIWLQVRPYETVEYYQNFGKVSAGQLSNQDFRNQFNHLMADNYRVAPIISQAQVSEIFIWGTNPMLYALTDTQPTGRFTVSFHITDFDAFDETFRDLEANEPQFIVVMHDEQAPFPELYNYLEDYYLPNASFTHFTLWKRSDMIPSDQTDS